MPKPIPLSVPRISGNAWRYVKRCLDTEWVSSAGPFVRDFEKSVESFTGARHAIAGSNGTASLHAMMLACGLGPGDAVLVPALSFIATANAVTYTGATCVFADCEPRRFNMDLDLLEDFLSKKCRRARGGLILKGTRLRVRALLATHILGYPMDMDLTAALARRHGLMLLEDAAESVGSSWKGRHTGTFGRVGALSFNGNKIITSGGGGMVLTNDDALARSVRHLTTQAKRGDEYAHDAVGYNYRMTNIAAALGLSQMELLPDFLEQRERIGGWYRDALPGAEVEPVHPDASWNRWLITAVVRGKGRRDALLRRLAAAGCQARPLWQPLPLQKPYRGHPTTGFPNARRAYADSVSLPSSTSLTRAQVERVARAIGREEEPRLLA